jgi:hypothetical protein
MNQRALFNRRRVLKALAAATAGVAVSDTCWRARGARAGIESPYFFIGLCCFGGANIIDSFMPIKASEAFDPATLDCFPDDQVLENPAVSPLRVVDAKVQSVVGVDLPAEATVALSPIVAKHYQQTMVSTLECSSVNHVVAQHRALTGGGAWNGRTLQEMVALAYGEGLPLPNVNMANLGYLENGDDGGVPDWALAEAVPQPLLKPLSMSGYRGITGAPPADLVELARGMRNDGLDPQSSFYQTFRHSERLARWKQQRSVDAKAVEDANLIDKLIFVPDVPQAPFSQFGLNSSEDAALLNTVFPNILTGEMDPLEQQAALTFLLLKHRVSVSVTLSTTFAPVLGGAPELLGVKNPPLSFDGAHNDHRSAQAIMWQRMLGLADKLIDLLKATPFDDTTGETMWDRTMIHFATDFGRSKRRPPDAVSWGTAHDLNNGTVTISPLVNGNSLLGGVFKGESAELDGHTYGFDLDTGAPDPSRKTSEAEHYAGLLQALDIDTSPAGLPDVPCMRNGGV